MKNKKTFLALALLAGLLLILSGCQTRISDSGFSLKTVGKNIDNNIYELDVTMLGNVSSNKDLNAQAGGQQFSDLYGYGNMRLWQDGKGLVMVHVNSITPNLSYVQAGMDIVLKTTDLKVMAITEGYRFNVKCRSDYEPVASLENNEMSSARYDTYELDFCRMTNPEITLDNAAGAE